jgi:hypothetical protein
MKARTTKYLEIVQAEYVSGYKIRLSFNDGMVRVMDFEPFLRQAMNPDITKFRQLRNFKQFHLHHGDLMWGDFEMIFPILDLYRGNILKGEASAPSYMVLNDAVPPVKTIFREKAGTAASVSYRKTKRNRKRTAHTQS